jgi:hypothetical protein
VDGFGKRKTKIERQGKNKFKIRVIRYPNINLVGNRALSGGIGCQSFNLFVPFFGGNVGFPDTVTIYIRRDARHDEAKLARMAYQAEIRRASFCAGLANYEPY